MELYTEEELEYYMQEAYNMGQEDLIEEINEDYYDDEYTSAFDQVMQETSSKRKQEHSDAIKRSIDKGEIKTEPVKDHWRYGTKKTKTLLGGYHIFENPNNKRLKVKQIGANSLTNPIKPAIDRQIIVNSINGSNGITHHKDYLRDKALYKKIYGK